MYKGHIERERDYRVEFEHNVSHGAIDKLAMIWSAS